MRRMPQARGHKARYREEAFYELEKVAKQRFNNDNVKLEVKAVARYSKQTICTSRLVTLKY